MADNNKNDEVIEVEMQEEFQKEIQENQKSVLTETETELYDRQLRLWGVEAQKRLLSAKVLVIGIDGVGAEVSKNLILAGVKSVVLSDSHKIEDTDYIANFYLRAESRGNRAVASVERARMLNPTVEVNFDIESVFDKMDEFYKQFDVVCASGLSRVEYIKVNAACRRFDVKFFAADAWNYMGYVFADLIKHEYIEEVVQPKESRQAKKIEMAGGEPGGKQKFEKRCEKFIPFEYVINAPKSSIPEENAEIFYMMLIRFRVLETCGRNNYFLNSFDESDIVYKNILKDIVKTYRLRKNMKRYVYMESYAPLGPVCAIIGGVVAQEVIKVLSGKGAPYNNFFTFDPHTLNGQVLKVGCEPKMI